MVQLLDLPLEVLECIVQHIGSQMTLNIAAQTCKTIRAIAIPLFDRCLQIQIDDLAEATKAQEVLMLVQQAGFSRVEIRIDYDEDDRPLKRIVPATSIWCEVLNKLNHVTQLCIIVNFEDNYDDDEYTSADLREDVQILAYAVKSLLLLPSMAGTFKTLFLDISWRRPHVDCLYVCEAIIPLIVDVSNIEIRVDYDYLREALHLKLAANTSLLVPPPFHMSDSKSGYKIAIEHRDDWFISSYFFPVTSMSLSYVGPECCKHFAACASSLRMLSIDSGRLQAVDCDYTPELWLVNLQDLKWTSRSRAGTKPTKLVGSLRTPALKTFSLYIDSLEGLDIFRDPYLSSFLRSCQHLRRCRVHLSLELVDWTMALLDGLQAAYAALIAHNKAMILDLQVTRCSQQPEIHALTEMGVDTEGRRQAFATVEKLRVPLSCVEASSTWYRFLKRLPRLQHLIIDDASDLEILTAYFRTAYLPILSEVECYGFQQLDQTDLREVDQWPGYLSDLVYVSIVFREWRLSNEEIKKVKEEWASKGVTLNIYLR